GGQVAAQTSNAQPLPYFNGYLVTGNYVVGSVDLQPVSGGTGFATGTIHMSGVPAQADILAAWLYWETIVVDDPDHSQLAGVKFRDIPIDVTDPNTTIVKKASQSLSGPFASCYGSNGQHPLYTMYQLRADVRRFLPIQYDFSDNSVPPASTTKRLVNDTDLQTNKDPNSKTGATYALHTVTLPDSGAGNHIPLSAGASL